MLLTTHGPWHVCTCTHTPHTVIYKKIIQGRELLRNTLDEIGHLPVMCEALGSITSIRNKTMEKHRSGTRSEELEVVEKRVSGRSQE